MHYAALMDNNASEFSAAIGAKVRSERQAREWTLDQLAKHSGRKPAHAHQRRAGSANPSVTTLLRLSDALGIGLQALVAVPQTKPVKVIRGGDAPALWTGTSGGRGVLLAGTAPPDVLELWDWTLAPGDRHDSEAHVRGTKEILQVREGTVTVDRRRPDRDPRGRRRHLVRQRRRALVRQRGHRSGPVLPHGVRARCRRGHEDRGEP